MEIRPGLAAVILLLAGCATTSTEPASDTTAHAAPAAKQTVSDADANAPVCNVEERTGSHVNRGMVCRTREQIERERAAAERAMQRSRQSANTVQGN